ncbi:MAG: DEAD/DEAH box helicase [Patescibacteria group bacterium]|nr:DEAD/DEAH box helicase [Patescibacteria group bacterium]
MQSFTSGLFSQLGIAPAILDILDKNKFVHPTPIQEKAIPIGVTGKDLVGIAQTGTGKTLAFGIPMIQGALQGKGPGLVVLPTRELAMQVKESLKMIGQPLGIKTTLIVGGASMQNQIAEIRRGPDIVIGTPGRIIDHLNQKSLSLSGVRTLVLDEADRMLDMGFASQLKQILQHVPAERQTLLFSATMPPEIMKIARTFMQLPVQIEIVPPGTAASTVSHEVYILPREQKLPLLLKLLQDYKGSVLVFMRTKFSVKKAVRHLHTAGFSSGELHSNRSPNQRRDALEGFKTGRYRILVATDIAARGIDVTNIELVVNFDLPTQAEDYVHRIGRTGRAGATGHAISFATPDQRGDLQTIEKVLRKSIPLSRVPEGLPVPPPAPQNRNHPGFRHQERRFPQNRGRQNFNRRRR